MNFVKNISKNIAKIWLNKDLVSYNFYNLKYFKSKKKLILKNKNINIEENTNHISYFFKTNSRFKINCKTCDIDYKILKNVILFPGPSFNGKAIYFLNEKFYISEGYDIGIESIPLQNYYEKNEDLKFSISILFKKFFLSKNFISNLISKNGINSIESGINLLDSIDNYWHFLFESAVKLIVANEMNIPLNVPILLPDNLNKNLYKIIDIINSGEYARKIIKLPSFKILTPLDTKLIKIENNYHISDIIHLPHNFNDYFSIKSSYRLKNTIKFNLYPIRKLVVELKTKLNINSEADPNIKLFVKRTSINRISSDQKELEIFLISKGFQIFDPSSLSLEDQIKICSKASAFIGFSGAALSNSIFLPKDSVKVFFLNKTFDALVPVWNSLLSNVYIYDNEFVANHENDIHGIPFLSKENWNDLKSLFEKKIIY